MIHTIALYGSATVTAVLFVGIAFGLEGLAAKATIKVSCTEVAEVLQEAVESNLISQHEADQTAQRCFDTQEDSNE